MVTPSPDVFIVYNIAYESAAMRLRRDGSGIFFPRLCFTSVVDRDSRVEERDLISASDRIPCHATIRVLHIYTCMYCTHTCIAGPARPLDSGGCPWSAFDQVNCVLHVHTWYWPGASASLNGADCLLLNFAWSATTYQQKSFPRWTRYQRSI